MQSIGNFMKLQPLFTMFILIFFLSACDNGANTTKVSNEKPIRIGYMICDSYEDSKARFAPFTAYLSEKTGRKFEMVLANTYEFEDLVKQKKVDFVHVNSIVAVILKKDHNLNLLAVDVRGRNGHKASGTIVSLKGSGIKTIEDMRGKSMVFGPALAPFGYMAQYSMLLENGFDPETDFSSYTIPAGSAKHEKVLYGVLFGKYDVGAAPRIDVDLMSSEHKINMDDFNIVAESITMPYCTIGAVPEVDPALSQQVLDIALNLKKDETVLVNGEVLKVLDRMWLDGFVKAVDSEYDTIRDRLKRANMAPYRKF